MLTFYSVIVLEVVFLMAVLGVMASNNDLLSQNKRRLFLLIALSIVVAILAEWSGSMTVLYEGRFRQIHVWTKVVELSLTPVVPFLCAEVLNCSARAARKLKWYSYVLLIHTGLEILSAFGEFIFYVDQTGVFRHGPFYWIYLATYLAGGVYVLWVGYQTSHQYQGRNKIILPLLLAFLLFGVAANQMDKSIKSAWLTVALDVTLIYIFYNEMIQRVDEMTMLLNRASYNRRLHRIHEPVTIQFFDVDLFKYVNDEYGHSYGDQCLGKIGQIIRNVYGKHGKCYRIGGDEFCVILDSDRCSVEELNTWFFTAMGKHRGGDPRFPYLSLGYARYDPARETVEEAVRTADAMMYRYKERNKIKYGPIARAAANQEPEEGRMAGQTALDTSGLVDRTFAAFSGNSQRGYLYLCNLETRVSRWSLRAVEYFGLPGEYIFESWKIWESYIHPQDRAMYHESIEAVLAGRKQVHELEYRVRNRQGEYVVCTCRAIVLQGKEGEPRLFAGNIVNHGIVVEVDSVTNLHTSTEFTKSIHELIDEGIPACIVELGIEHFRHVNAMYGQEGGDQVLRLFAIELRDLVEGRGRVFRLEGAKFALCLRHADRREAQEIFQSLRQISESNIKIQEFRIPLRLYGGAVFLDDRHTYNAYTVRSGLIYAMEQSRMSYRSELVFLEEVRQTIHGENVQLHAQIHRSAMEGCRNFFLCYQPIVSFSTGKILGAEALLRWRGEPYGVVPPDSFIPWLENDPAFIQVGKWILRQAIRETEPLRRADPDFVLNVNIADTQLEHREFREDVLGILDEENCLPKNLCLELTERCRRLDLDFLTDELRFFQSHGIAVAIDDFGTGTSSLTLLLQLPFDELKVDKTLVSEALTNPNNRCVMEYVLRGCQQVGLRTCVEGIETQEQHDLVASLAGDCYQGYYCCKPLPIEEFLAFYRDGQKA